VVAAQEKRQRKQLALMADLVVVVVDITELVPKLEEQEILHLLPHLKEIMEEHLAY
jgi:L-lactate utilization protein LutC